jgi:allantoinase
MGDTFEGYAAGTEEPDLREVPLPGGARIAVRFQLTLEDWEAPPELTGELGPGAPSPAIDYRVVSARMYGLRTGIFRLLDVMDEAGCVASVTTCGICGDRWPSVVAEVARRGHEIVGHGYAQEDNAAFLDEEQDYAVVTRTVAALERASGYRPVGWAGAASRRGPFTVKSLLRAGMIYTNDFREADVPFIAGRMGERRLVAMPRNDEINDNYAVLRGGYSPANYVDYFKRAFDRLHLEGERHHGRVLTAVVHATAMGRPWGASALAECVTYAKKHPDAWVTTSRAIAEHYLREVDA